MEKLTNRDDVVRIFLDDVRALHRSAEERGITYRKSRTNLQLTHAAPIPNGKLQVDLLEYLTWFYTDGDDLKHQARMQPIQLILSETEGGWKIERVNRIGEREERNLVKGELNFRPSSIVEGNRKRSYDRRKAQQYAELWWDGFNPQYKKFDVDCTNYISQCLYAGGMPMEFSNRKDRGWWYRNQGGTVSWSHSWAVAHALRWYLESSGRATAVGDAKLLTIGDVICYDWDGDGRWQHNTIVVAFDRNGMPLVNAHTVASQHRFWDYKDSYAWTERTQYRLFHIQDTF
ncbi:hypothetical protein skT53_19490 [Effusibacillus dendaii]|uniref:Putative amidase domain-containing protein n=2 Tax=Effusibacillus dendaii TaxID=2743772 RepID=A0A7I8DA21_9BACL|nr:hypothetical protein skT53_19490 [Effusibacillus dendaii]